MTDAEKLQRIKEILAGREPHEFKCVLIEEVINSHGPVPLHKSRAEQIVNDLQFLPAYVAALKKNNNKRTAAVKELAGPGKERWEVSHIDKRITRLEKYFGCKIQDLPENRFLVIRNWRTNENGEKEDIGASLFTTINLSDGKSVDVEINLPNFLNEFPHPPRAPE